jgi:hypothetical protein
MITLSFHTSHALQPLDAACFKPLKATFRKERDVPMAIRHYIELKQDFDYMGAKGFRK